MMIHENKFALFIKYFLLILFSLIVLFPLFITVFGGFKTTFQLRLNLFGLPKPVAWINFIDVLDISRSRFFYYLFNSTFIMAFTVLFILIMSCLAGFALSRLNFPGRELIFNYFLLGLLFPLAVAILPLYIEIRTFRLLNNYFGVILPQVAFSLPFQIMLARGFFKQIPLELEEASTMDGCGHMRFLLTVIVPLSTPVLTTISVLVMVFSWNNFFLPLLVMNEAKLFTLPMGVMDFQGQYVVEWNRILAFVTLSMIPAVVFYILAQKYIIAGLTGGAIKE